MMKLLRMKLIFFVFVFSFSLQSCSGIKNLVSSDNKSSGKKSAKGNTGQEYSQSPARVEKLAQRNIKAGNYQKAINIYSIECHKQPRNSQLMQMYAKSLNGMRSMADSAFANRDLAVAGRIYYTLEKNYPRFNHVAPMLSFDDAYLNNRLSYCRKFLSTQGFQEYRNGRLNSALLSWRSVLDIDPDNEDIKEAMRTATLQQKNLQ
jgi:tetratricopeptide (TPR) repeat protein